MSDIYDMRTIPIPELESYQKEAFWSRVTKSDGCWNWIGYKSFQGYGVFHIKRRPYRAHRVSLFLAGRPKLNGMGVDHLCRNKLCVRPDHLEIVTQKENVLRGQGITAILAKSTHCVNGHRFKIVTNRVGKRKICLICERRYNRECRRRKRG